MSKFKFTVPVKTTDLVFPIQKLIQETAKLRSIYRAQGLSVTQGQILVCIAKCGPMTIVGLTSEMSLDKSTISQTLASMQTSGLIELAEHEEDRRFKHARITASGQLKVEAINAAFDRALKRMFQSLEEKEINATSYGLLRFVDLLSGLRDISFRRILGAAKAPGTSPSLFNLE